MLGPAGSKAALVLGLDEAGRGSLVGPLVVGGFVTDTATAARLPQMGVRDSKLLSPARRESLYRLLGGHGQRLSVTLPPATIDRHVRVGGLNHLEAHAFARLVRRAGVPHVFADACDPDAKRFGRSVARLAGIQVHMDARHRADATIPVVAAASIVAKVRRDRALARLRREIGEGIGSGYPSDDRTVQFVRDRLRPGGPLPPWLRSSWRTMERLKPRPTALTLDAFAP